MKKINVTKKAVKVVLNVLMPLFVFLLGFLLATCLPEKQSTLVRKNSSWGENQMAIRKLPPVQSFMDYLGYVEAKKIDDMWNNSSTYRKKAFGNDKDNMRYDYWLTSKYEVQYIIPIGEGSRLSLKDPKRIKEDTLSAKKEDSVGVQKKDSVSAKKEEKNVSSKSPISERTFSFYALIRFEDDVCVEGEVDRLKDIHNTELKQICDSTNIFASVLDEMYEFVDHRFVIDSSEIIKRELKDYLMKTNMNDFINQEWCFPLLFAKHMQLPPKEIDRLPGALYLKLGHSMLSEVVMLEEDDVWKLSRFRTIAMSRWEGDKELKK